MEPQMCHCRVLPPGILIFENTRVESLSSPLTMVLKLTTIIPVSRQQKPVESGSMGHFAIETLVTPCADVRLIYPMNIMNHPVLSNRSWLKVLSMAATRSSIDKSDFCTGLLRSRDAICCAKSPPLSMVPAHGKKRMRVTGNTELRIIHQIVQVGIQVLAPRWHEGCA
jgi:hypothetical protein